MGGHYRPPHDASPVPRLWIRADAGPSIGTGHIMRCLALAQAWRLRGGEATFLCARIPPALRERLEREGCRVLPIDAEPGTAADARKLGRWIRGSRRETHPARSAVSRASGPLAARGGAACQSQPSVVLDGYALGADYQRAVWSWGPRLLVVDDYGHAAHYACDAILNQNLGADPRWYEHRPRETHLLLGTRYALLRQEFVRHQPGNRRTAPDRPRVLVTFGGADPRGMTARVLAALAEIDDGPLEIDVLLGAAFPHQHRLEQAVRATAHTVRLWRDPPELPRIMAQADLSISAGGSTCWELCHAGVGLVILVTADNQRAIAARLAAAGQTNLGWYADCSDGQIARAVGRLVRDGAARLRMGRAARRLVDGRGAQRVVDLLWPEPAEGPAGRAVTANLSAGT